MLAENVLWHLNLRSRRPENNLDGTRADRPGTRPLAGGHGRDPAGRGPRGPRGGVRRQRRAPRPPTGPFPGVSRPGEPPPVRAPDGVRAAAGLEIVTRLGLALRTKSLNDELRL